MPALTRKLDKGRNHWRCIVFAPYNRVFHYGIAFAERTVLDIDNLKSLLGGGRDNRNSDVSCDQTDYRFHRCDFPADDWHEAGSSANPHDLGVECKRAAGP
jgi:hypothetical protein